MNGTLYGIGVGPGDPELLTLKAVRLIAASPVLAWPAPMEGNSLARSIAAPHLPPGKIEIALRMPFTADRAPAEAAYNKGAAEIAAHLDHGRDVAFLCEGDPLTFGSFIYVLERLAGKYPVAVVPGVSSPMAAAAAHCVPLASGEERLVVVPAGRKDSEIDALLAGADAFVFLKVGRHAARLRALLARHHLLEKALYAERLGGAGEKLARFADILPENAVYFSLVLVRK